MASRALALPTIQIEPADAFTLRMHRSPDIQIAEAQLCANALVAAVKRHGWSQNFGGKKDHLYYEAWSFLASMYRVSARIRPEMTKPLELCDAVGFEACAEAVHGPSQTILSVATSMCMDDEENWDMRPVKEYDEKLKRRVIVGQKSVPLFQLRSMAETRACSKALRLVFSAVVAMAGYEATPKEEMTGNENAGEDAPKEPQQKPADGSGSVVLINEKQAKRIWAIGYTAGMPKEGIIAALKRFGFERAEHVTTDKYEALCAFVEKGGK